MTMPCERARELLPLFADGDAALAAADRAGLEEHLAACPGCRTELEALGAQIELLRGAGRWARSAAAGLDAAPVGGRRLAGGLRSGRPRVRPRRGRFWPAAAAVAALVLLALGVWRLVPRADPADAPAGHLVSGLVLGSGEPVGLLSPGGVYVVPAGRAAELELRGGARLELSGGSSFLLPEDFAVRPAVRVLSGTVRCRSAAPLELRGERLAAGACGSFALAAPVSAEPPAAAPRAGGSGLTGLLFPVALAAEGPAAPRPAGPEAFLLEEGRAELSVEQRTLAMAGREAAVGGDGTEPARGAPEGLLAGMLAERDAVLAGLLSPRYRAILAEYTARRAGYVERLARPALESEERADLAWRIALMDELRAAHAARLESLAAGEAGRLARAQLLSARIEVLGRLVNRRSR